MQEVTITVKLKFYKSFAPSQAEQVAQRVASALTDREKNMGLGGSDNKVTRLIVEVPNNDHAETIDLFEEEIDNF